MSTQALCNFASALQAFLAEQTYVRQTQERVEKLEQVGLSFSPDELSKVGGDITARCEEQFKNHK
jgi:hypothetical protein